MEVKPGYKQTEVGAIPEDWDTVKLPGVVWFQEGPGVRNHQFTITGVKLFNGTNIQSGRICLDKTSRHISEREAYGAYSHFLADAGDIVIACSGISVSRFDEKVGVLSSEHLPLCMNTSTMRFKIASPRLCQDYFRHFLRSQSFKDQIGGTATGSAQLNFGPAHVGAAIVPLPAKAEQEAIAEALSDADALIESLEQLLVKKRQLKQGAMQELLTGKKRLPDFSEEWEVVNLDGVIDRITGVWGANDSSPDHPRCTEIIRAGDISQDGLLNGSAQRYLSDPEFSKTHCRLDDIVITTSGNRLGKVWWCDGRPNVAASNFVRILRPRRGKSQGRYLSYLLRSEAGLKQLQEHTATSAYPNLRPSFFAAAWISLPPISEQTAIAAILSDMDAEIAALEAKLAKNRQIKHGMMQELLTGRIRLV